MLNDFNKAQMLEGALKDEGYFCCGNYRGYNVRLQQTGENAYVLNLPVCSQTDPQKANLNGWLQQLAKINGHIITEAGVQYHNAVVKFKADTQEALKQNTENIVGSLVNYLTAGGFQSACEMCGQPKPDVTETSLGGRPFFVCGSCNARLAADLGQPVNAAQPVSGAQPSYAAQPVSGAQPAYAAQPVSGTQTVKAAQPASSNALLGTLGALVGALGGGAVWFLLGRIGIIAGIAGFLIAFLALLLYEKFGGSIDLKGVIICLVLTLGTVWLANRMTWSFSAWQALKGYGYSFGDCFKEIGEIVKTSDLTFDYYKDLVVGILFTAISSFKTFVGAFAGANAK